MLPILVKIMTKYGLVMSFMLVGAVMWISYQISGKLTKGRIHGSAIAILTGLVLAYIGGAFGGTKGVSNVEIFNVKLFAGIGIMGGGMLRDFAIISTAFGARIEEMKKAGLAGAVALFAGILTSFIVGVVIALLFGYSDVVSATTIGAGAVTFIVGPVTGAALGATSEVVAISIAAGVVKSILVMIMTPFVANWVGLDNPQSAMVYGGLMGTTSGTAAGLAATDPALVPYGAMVATFYTGFGCLLCPSVLFLITRAILGA